LVLALERTPCQILQDQRTAIAAMAMAEEIALAMAYRERICPALNQQAALANANSQPRSTGNPGSQASAPIDYDALIHCRQTAEQQLEHDNRILYRNRLGFSFYTDRGAEAARQADRLSGQMQELSCRP
jgi:hypothetical protein